MDLSKYLNKLKIRDRIFILYVTPVGDLHPVGLPNTQYNISLPDIKQQTNNKNSSTPIFHYHFSSIYISFLTEMKAFYRHEILII